MFRIISNEVLALQVHRITILAPQISRLCRAGQCVILRVDDGYKPIALSVTDADPQAGTITLVVHASCEDTQGVVAAEPGEEFESLEGPFGQAIEIGHSGNVTCVAEGMGAAVVFPVAKALAMAGNKVTTILGARSARHLILRRELAQFSHVTAVTEDGSMGIRGTLSMVLDAILKDAMESPDAVFAAGGPPLVASILTQARRHGITAHVIPNAITGSCGGCQVLSGLVTSPCVAAE